LIVLLIRYLIFYGKMLGKIIEIVRFQDVEEWRDSEKGVYHSFDH